MRPPTGPAVAAVALAVAALAAAPALAGMKVPVPLATRLQQADAVVLGTVTAVDAVVIDDVRTVSLIVDVNDSLGAPPPAGPLAVRVIQKGVDTSGDFGSVYAVAETRLFVLKRARDGVLEQQLFVAPTLATTPPRQPHPLARGGRWLVLPDWGYGGVLFPLGLPLTFADASGARRCDRDGELDTFIAWFTWEDLVSVAQGGPDGGLAQLAPPTSCDPGAPFPVAVGCSPERCPPSWWHRDVIDCRGPDGALRLTRAGADTFAVSGRLKGRRLPVQVRAAVDSDAQALILVDDGPGGREALRLHLPWYAVVALVAPMGGTPPPVPSLHVQASARGRRHPDDTSSLLCTAP